MQRFLDDTVEGRFIKSILQDTYIPRYQSVIDGDYIVIDTHYVFGHSIIKCTKSGTLGKDAKYKVTDNFNINEFDLTTKGNFISKESFYDSDTHYHLGEYLRYYRGQTGIDLMPLYNCYNNVYNNKFTLTPNGLSSFSNNLFKILQVPIKFNKTYTLALDCSSNVTLCPAFIIDGDYVFSGGVNLTNRLYENENPTKIISSMDFLNPQTYIVNNDDGFLQRYEYCLTLLVQVPYNCDSSFVVLEGDYTDVRYKNIINTEGFLSYNSFKLTIPEYKHLGDVNDDGTINGTDKTSLQYYIEHHYAPSPFYVERADVNQDGVIDINDYNVLSDYIDWGILPIESSAYYRDWIYNSRSIVDFPEGWYYRILWNSIPDPNDIIDIKGSFVSWKKAHKAIYLLRDDYPTEPLEIEIIYNYDYAGFDSLSELEKNKLFISNLSLLEVNDKVSYAFSDKLILYLLQSSITSNESIYNNILRVQKDLQADRYYDAIDDVWNDYIRKIIYDKYFNKTQDLIGYVDADIENFLIKGN